MKILDYSFNEPRLLGVIPRKARYHDGGEGVNDVYSAKLDTPLIEDLIITPLFNSRMLP